MADENTGITIKHAEIVANGSSSLLHARIDYYLNDDIIEALNNGITLTFNVSLIIYQHRNWLWNKRRASLVFPYRLKYHTLSQTYQVTDVTSNHKQVFSGLYPALHALGTLNDLPLHNIAALQASKHSAKLSVALNIEALPLPMRPLAYITPNWHLSSNPLQWPLSQ